MRKSFLLIALISLCVIFPHSFARAQDNCTATPLTVGVYVSQPFVMPMDDSTFQGMAIELWQTISKSLGISSRYIQYHSFKELLEATVRGDVDILLTNLTVTHERATQLVVSYPWFDSGIRVMVNKEYRITVFEELLDSGRITIYMWLAASMFTLTMFITLYRRRIDAKFTREWKKGLAQSFHSLVLAAKSGQMSFGYVFGWVGYTLSAVWVLVGTALIVYVTSTLTTAMTSVSLHSNINSVYDLPGRTIGVVSGSVAQDFLHSLGIATKSYIAVADAVEDLHAKKINAIVSDAPVLEYWAYTRPDLKLAVVGNLFHPQKYAFAANGSHRELMGAVSLEIIKMHDDGELKALKDKYFGPLNL